jgi:hypothetical protein
VSYHESFWVVIGTAAPVIALAAAVALPEAYRTEDQVHDARRHFAYRPPPDSYMRSVKRLLPNRRQPDPYALWAAVRKAEGLSLLLRGCIYGQVFALGYSLVSLAIGRDLFTPLIAISGPLGGILIIASVVNRQNIIRMKLEQLRTSPDDGQVSVTVETVTVETEPTSRRPDDPSAAASNGP